MHLKASITKLLDDKKVKYAFVPSGATGFVQSLDVCINKPLKDRIRSQFDTWFKANADVRISKYNNILPPSKSELVSWILEAFDDLDNELIRKSFIYCGKPFICTSLLTHYRNFDSD